MSEIDRTICWMDSGTQRRSPCVGDSAGLVTRSPRHLIQQADQFSIASGPPDLMNHIPICPLRPFESTMGFGGPST